MQHRLISLLPLQLARWVGLVRSVEAIQLQSARVEWVLVARGRWLTRILRDEPLVAPNLIRPMGWDAPRPMVFRRQQEAEAYARHLGLMPRQLRWAVREGGKDA